MQLGSKLADACATVQALDEGSDECLRESSLLFLLLMLGTVWLGLSLYNFTKTSVFLAGPPKCGGTAIVMVRVVRQSVCLSHADISETRRDRPIVTRKLE